MGDARVEVQRRRASWQIAIYLAAGAFLAAVSADSFNANMMISVGVIILALVILVSLILGRSGTGRSRAARAAALAGALALLAVNALSWRYQTAKLEASMEPLLAALGTYRVMVGSYPERLDQLLHGHLAALPECPNGRAPYYFRNRSAGGYRILCVTFGFNKHAYDSQLNAWYDWD
jgi:hypothetical protein